MRIQLICYENGFGLSQDIRVLRQILEPMGHDVHFTDYRKPRKNIASRHYHVNLFLEVMSPAFFAQAARNYFIPNPEWVISTWNKHLPVFDLILAKTHDAERIFSGMNLPTRYIGFTSEDHYSHLNPNVPDDIGDVLHLVGHSVAKGTGAVIEAAKQLPDIRFTVIGNAPKEVPPNVKVIRNASNEVVRSHQNTAIHCQPSSYEGFGHAINEARAHAALVITTAAEPMSELITEDFGFGAAHCATSTERLATHKHVCVDSLVDMIQAAVECVGTPAAGAIGQRARDAYLKGREDFTQRIGELMAA